MRLPLLDIWSVITGVSTPLILGGLALAVLYSVYRGILHAMAPEGAKEGLFRPVSGAQTAGLLDKIVFYVFVLALVAMCLGFLGYIWPKPGPHPKPLPDLPPVTAVNPAWDGQSLTVIVTVGTAQVPAGCKLQVRVGNDEQLTVPWRSLDHPPDASAKAVLIVGQRSERAGYAGLVIVDEAGVIQKRGKAMSFRIPAPPDGG